MDSLSGMDVFVQVAEARSLSVAARHLGVTPSAVSKTLSKLEARLGVRLLNRTTRQVSLTEDGRSFLERCRRILAEVRDAEAAVSRSRLEPGGRVRVSCPAGIFRRFLQPRLPTLLERFPQLGLDLSLRDAWVDPMTESLDLSVGFSRASESPLVQKRLATWRLRLVAAPGYLARRGTPKTVEALSGHDLLAWLDDWRAADWRLRTGPGSNAMTAVSTVGRVGSSSLDVLRELALEGRGIARLPEGLVAEDLKKGALTALLDDACTEEVSLLALYPPSDPLAPRVRATLDWMAEAFVAAAPAVETRAPSTAGHSRSARTARA